MFKHSSNAVLSVWRILMIVGTILVVFLLVLREIMRKLWGLGGGEYHIFLREID